MFMLRAIAVLLGLLTAASPAHAQFLEHLTNPTVQVTINHPPGLGINVNKIAFGPATGKCADELVDALISDFVANQIEVLDRQNLSAIFAEHNLATSGRFDQASTAALGKILGPSTMIFVKTTRCETVQDRLRDTERRYDAKTKSYYAVNAFHARTRAFLKVSIQTVDLATGRIFAARSLEYSPEQTNKSYEGYPEMPATFDVLDTALKAAVTDVHRMLLPWSEKTELVYYNDKACGLNQAFAHLKAGNNDGALQQSIANLETCTNSSGVKDSILGHAYYNVGISYMIRNDHDRALEFLQKAASLRPGDIVTKAIADCQRAKQLAAEMQQIQASIVVEPRNGQAGATGGPQPDQTGALTNADVIQMARSKVSDAIIIHKIQNSKRSFDTSPTGLTNLTKAGVSERVLMEMIKP